LRASAITSHVIEFGRIAAILHANANLVIASAAKQSIVPQKERMDCFAALAMTGDGV
jgi:hypothetical protein